MTIKDIILNFIWLFKSGMPKESICEHCGRFSPEYLEDCPYCTEDDPSTINEENKL